MFWTNDTEFRILTPKEFNAFSNLYGEVLKKQGDSISTHRGGDVRELEGVGNMCTFHEDYVSSKCTRERPALYWVQHFILNHYRGEGKGDERKYECEFFTVATGCDDLRVGKERLAETLAAFDAQRMVPTSNAV